ncbi:MAG: nitric oxide reductase F protein [Silicimonas sp.]|nr:nitric oxide reductase F protein [Silicimonas sp.]
MTPLVHAWIGLVALSAATTLVAVGNVPAPWAGALILLAAWAKARLIFLWYLGLDDVAGWRGGLLAGLAAFMILLFGLYLAA